MLVEHYPGVVQLGLVLHYFVISAGCSEAQEALIKELFLTRNYDEMSRPVENFNDTLIVHFAVTLNILVFVVSAVC